jgi:hypothetical protein
MYIIVEMVFKGEYKIAVESFRGKTTPMYMTLADTYYLGEPMDNGPSTVRTNSFSTIEDAETAIKELSRGR